MGKTKEFLGSGLRSFQVQHHFAYYTIEPNFIYVIRVLHERMDVDSIFHT